MQNYENKIRAVKRKRLLTWLIRQTISACIVIPVVYKWPEWKWLLPVWIILALLSLAAILILFKKLENQVGDLVAEIKSAHGSEISEDSDDELEK